MRALDRQEASRTLNLIKPIGCDGREGIQKEPHHFCSVIREVSRVLCPQTFLLSLLGLLAKSTEGSRSDLLDMQLSRPVLIHLGSRSGRNCS